MSKLIGGISAIVGGIACIGLWAAINIGIPVLILVALYKYVFGG